MKITTKDIIQMQLAMQAALILLQGILQLVNEKGGEVEVELNIPPTSDELEAGRG